MFAKCIIPALGDGDGLWNDPLGGVYARSLNKDSFYSDLAHRIVVEILELDPLPTALFVTYDILACWIWAVLEGKGIRIPEQMSIVGFDWRAQWDKSLADELDTAAQDFEGFGRHAVELLLDRISGEAPTSPRHVLLDAPLVIRSSTVSPPSSRSSIVLATSVPASEA
jgi:LacI family transcriptional regulator